MRKSTALISLLIIVMFGSCRRSGKPDYIFLITLDTTREDHVLLDPENNTITPNLAALAESGQYFKNAYALIPITLPSHYAMFYSRHPYQLNIYNNGQSSRLRAPSVTEILKKNGYATGAVISLGSLGKKYGLNKGFDHYIEEYRRPYLWYKSAEEVNEDAFRLIHQLKEHKAFFWIHYSDPHEPYFPPAYRGKFTLRLNRQPVFSCLSTERALIKQELEIMPGNNILAFKTKLPGQFNKDPDLTAQAVGYENLSWAIPDEHKDLIEIQYPGNWSCPQEESDQERDFQSAPELSELKIINHRTVPVPVQLTFIYRLLLTETAAQRLYQEEVRYMDSQIGEFIHFLKSQSLYDKSAFLIMGDHGEGLGEYRGCVGHIHYLNKIFTKVPLIAAGAGIAKKKPGEQLVSNLNIAPAILDLLDIPKPTSMLGPSLFHPGKSKKLLLETYAPEAYSDAFSLIDYPYQIIFYSGREEEQMELIHLENDFAGIKNIIATADPKIKKEMIQSIQDIVPGLMEAKKNKSQLSKEDLEILKSLGYIR